MSKKSNVIRMYDVKPEMALDHLNRTTGLNFERMPQNLAGLVNGVSVSELNADELPDSPPILTDVVAIPG